MASILPDEEEHDIDCRALLDVEEHVGESEDASENCTAKRGCEPDSSSLISSLDGDVKTAGSSFTTTNAPKDAMPFCQHVLHSSLITYPLILSEIFQNTLPVMDMAFVGQLGKEDVAAVALATSWYNVWNGAMIGFMSGVVATPLSQLHGAGITQSESFRNWSGSSFFIVFITTIFHSLLIGLCGPAMKYVFRQDPEISKVAGEFSLRLIPGLFPLYAFKFISLYLQSQDHLAPTIWVGFLANGCNALLNWALIFKAGWGISGAPWATSITRLAEFLLILGYMCIRRQILKDKWPRFACENLSWESSKRYMILGVSGACAYFLEAVFFEITSVFAGLLGTVQLAAHGIAQSIDAFLFFTFPSALGTAASIRVGQFISQNAQGARKSSHSIYFLGLLTEAVLVSILYPCRYSVAHFFSNDDEVANLVSEIIPIMCIFMMGDVVAATTSGVLRGLGRQIGILILNVSCLLLMALPITYALTFVVGLGVFGLWWGLVVGLYTIGAIGVFLLLCVNWRNEVEKTKSHLEKLQAVSSHPNGNDDKVLIENEC